MPEILRHILARAGTLQHQRVLANSISIEALPDETRGPVEDFLRSAALSPAGRLRPRLRWNGDTWCALVGPNAEEGTAGFGPTPVEALRAFNRHFGRAGEETAADNAPRG